MCCNIFVLTHLSLYAEDIRKIHNYRTEHKIVPFGEKNIWLGCRADFVLGNLLHSFGNVQAASKSITEDSSLLLFPGTSSIYWFGFSLSLNSAHCCFVGFGLTMSYPVGRREGVVAVDAHLFSRDFRARAAYEVPSLRIEDIDWVNCWEHHSSISFPWKKLEPLHWAYDHDIARGKTSCCEAIKILFLADVEDMAMQSTCEITLKWRTKE